MYLSLQYHRQNDSCIKMGSDESHFNVSLTVRDTVTNQPTSLIAAYASSCATNATALTTTTASSTAIYSHTTTTTEAAVVVVEVRTTTTTATATACFSTGMCDVERSTEFRGKFAAKER